MAAVNPTNHGAKIPGGLITPNPDSHPDMDGITVKAGHLGRHTEREGPFSPRCTEGGHHTQVANFF